MPNNDSNVGSSKDTKYPFTLPEYKRYGRQMILPGFGVQGQMRLSKASVLVIGAGGLGCPAVQYLAAAGVGKIAIVDHDHVETSNLARQILHTDSKVGWNKADSAANAARIINPHITVEAIHEAFSVSNAIQLISRHDIVLDCTDNVMTRYLISDAAVMCGVQVVSGAGQGYEGQLIVLHKDLTLQTNDPRRSVSSIKGKEKEERGPCYRCLFPKAPRPEDVTDCEDGGVFGGVTGLVGTMQAVQTVKLLTGLGDEDEPLHMTLVSPFSYPSFRTVRLRDRRIATCRACGDPDLMTEDIRKTKIAADLSNEDYLAFCGLRSSNGIKNNPSHEIDVKDLSNSLDEEATIIDVRTRTEFDIVKLPSSINIPLREIQNEPSKAHQQIMNIGKEGREVYLVCRKGNDSQIAQQIFSKVAAESKLPLTYTNVKGGLQAWSAQVDDQFPVY